MPGYPAKHRKYYKDPAYLAYGRWLKETWQKCSYCSERGLTVDHVPALSEMPAGGWTGKYVPACARCNSSRGGKLSSPRRLKHTREW